METEKRGRPPLSDEERERRRVELNKKSSEFHKGTKWAAQKKYNKAHSDNIYEPKLRLQIEFKSELHKLTKQTGLSITQLFLTAVEEKYKIVLHKPLDNSDKK